MVKQESYIPLGFDKTFRSVSIKSIWMKEMCLKSMVISEEYIIYLLMDLVNGILQC